jgi:hypothetical protein
VLVRSGVMQISTTQTTYGMSIWNNRPGQVPADLVPLTSGRMA